VTAAFDPNGRLSRPTYPRSPLAARMVAVMNFGVADRGLSLIPQASRCLRSCDIHEFIATCDAAGPGDRVGRVAYLGFASFERGGVAVVGDAVLIGGVHIGRIAGFDETHMPNHMNIVVRVAQLLDGQRLGLHLEAPLTIEPAAG
jgi:hypothetical protein